MLAGRVAVVTGGGTGIGEAIVRRFVADGMRVCVMGPDIVELERVAASLPDGSIAVSLGDVTSEDDGRRAVQAAFGLNGRLDALINNAAIGTDAVTGPPGSVLESDVAVWKRTIEVNLTGQYLMMRAALPHMIEARSGSIVNIASTGGMSAFPDASAYCSSKAGVIMLTRQAATDYGKHGIRVNAVCPGWVRTSSSDHELAAIARATGRDMESLRVDAVRDVPLRRVAEPEEIAGACRFLVSDDASYVTGSVLVVDGGSSTTEAGTSDFSRERLPA